MTALRHVMILASAGSGKTYALTSRFVQLLAAGAAPERIVALTFTRKAAGEFFDEILKKLAGAASDAATAQQLAADIGAPGLGPGDFLALLRKMVDGMHRLRLGTLDSFFARVAQTFPLELGLTGPFEILQEHAARLERRRILRRMFARDGGGLAAAQAEFIEAFKRATFGTEEKRLGARLDAILDRYQENFLAAPDPTRWGEPARIWPRGTPWLGPEAKLADAIRDLRAALGPGTDGQRERWEAMFAGLQEWAPGTTLAEPVEYILKNALAVWDGVCGGRADMTVDRRKHALSGAACDALRRIVTQLVGAEFRRCLERTRGIHAVLRSYEDQYHDGVRRAGRLTFADVQRLLSPDAGAPRLGVATAATAADTELEPAGEGEGGAGGDQLDLRLDETDADQRPRGEGDPTSDAGDRRLLLDYRLDAEIDHWLLDEFQDTSFGQWSVLRNLIDEVVQDAEGRRSFFCVGDVKQAIYAWREGDPRLFREIFHHYNAAGPGTIEERHLVASWRSGPPVIELVNAVFGDAAAIAGLFPGEASEAWNREWRDHCSAVPQRTGQAALLHADDAAARWEVVRRILDEVRPLDRGLTCAVLVKRNDTATALAEFLRGAGIPAIAESDLAIATDNPLGAALLALVKAAAHPGDTLAREHLRMTPLGVVLDAEGLRTPDAITRRVFGQIHAAGFEAALAPWIARLEPKLAPDDAFSRLRARQFAAAAGRFDATGSRDADEFIAFMERHTVRPPESAAVVRVMTVHKSKGLGFDVVLVPDLEGKRIDEKRDGLAVRKAPDRSVDWVLDLPVRLLCEQDAVLADYVRTAEADACYENLSLLYVALTRAKRALYVVTAPVGKSTSRNFPRLLAETLGDQTRDVRVGGATLPGAWASGDPDWHAGIAPGEVSGSARERPPLACLAGAGPAGVRRVARRPSAAEGWSGSAATWFSLEAAGALEFGTAVHALLAQVEWAAPEQAAARAARWRERAEPPAAVTVAEACLAATALATVWRRPAGPRAEVWRERSFEIVLDGVWVTGTFDRVVIEQDAAGRASAAVVYDFKTDRITREPDVAAAVSRHAPQLNLYRRVAGVLTSLPPERIRGELVLTQVQRRVDVPAALRS